MSSPGQIVGGVLGAVVGFFTPAGPIIGAQIGMMVGGYIDPPKGPNITGPRLSDLSQQTASLGLVIPRLYGTAALFGNIFWIENNQLKEVSATESQGGKGGGGSSVTTYSYFGTFALGLCQGPIDGIKRIWIGGKLIYDASANTISGEMATTEALGISTPLRVGATVAGLEGTTMTFYYGTSDQPADPRMQAALGVDNAPAYRGMAYIVFYDLPLADWGNTLLGAQIKVEVVGNGSLIPSTANTMIQNDVVPSWYPGNGPFNPRLENGVFTADMPDGQYAVALNGVRVAPRGATTIGTWEDPINPAYNCFVVGVLINPETGADVVVTYCGTGFAYATGDLRLGETVIAIRTNDDSDDFLGAAVDPVSNRLYVMIDFDGLDSGRRLRIYEADGSLVSDQPAQINACGVANGISYSLIPGFSTPWCVEAGGKYLWSFHMYSNAGDNPFHVHRINDDGTVAYERRAWFTAGASPSPFDGVRGAMAAENGLCALLTHSGGFVVLSRNDAISPDLIPLSEIVETECLRSNLLELADIDASDLDSDMVRGYRLASVGALRAALEPLQAAWPFDVLQSGYGIAFRRRGTASVATIPMEDLGSVAGSEKARVRLSLSREMDTQLPRRVAVTYLDVTREYDLAEQSSERLNTDAVNVRKVELPIVMNANEAAGTAEVLNYLYWLERHDAAFVIGPQYRYLEPGDVVTVTGNGQSYLFRLNRIQYLPDGRLECAAKMASTAIYTPAAIGVEGNVTGQTLDYRGDTALALLDLPCVYGSTTDKPGFVAAMGREWDGWTGGTLFGSADQGTTWKSLAGIQSPGSLIGVVTAAPASGRVDVIDHANRITARFVIAAGLSSVSDAQLYAGQNYFAVGANGRWEIVGARTVVENSDGSWTFSDLLRGRFGTEHNRASHVAGDALVLLNAARLAFVGAASSDINMSRLYRAVTQRQNIDAASEQSFAYAGENLECRSPMNIKGAKNAGGDWSIGWTRRTRLPVEPFSGMPAPLGESSESYEVEIWDSTWTTLKRTITGLSSAAATYTNAQQVADFGSVQKLIYVKVYQLSATVGRGYAGQAVCGNLALLNVKSLIHFDDDPGVVGLSLGLHMDGTNGSTTFADVTGKTVTANGNAQISTAQYAPLTGNSASGYFDGTGDYLAVTGDAFGTGDFYIRGWVRVTTIASYFVIFDTRPTDHTTLGIQAYITNTGNLAIGTGNPYVETAGTTSISGSTWVNFEITRSSGVIYGFIDGNLEFTVANTSNFSNTAWHIGHNWDASATFSAGYIDDLSVISGLPGHTTSYSPPSVPFSISGQHITDSANNEIAVIGIAATVSDAAAFGGICLQANQASGYVSTPIIPLVDTYWTIDLWINPGDLPSSGYMMGVFDYGTNSDGDGGLCVALRHDGLLMCYFAYAVEINTVSTLLSVGERAHIFVQRSGPKIYIGMKGVVGGNINVSSTTFVGDKGFRIGYANISWLQTKAIKIDEFRVFEGEAKYPLSGTYVVPTTPFPDI
jgi:hypothetical protein